MIRKIFCAAIIVCGFVLDTYFYAFRFNADGLRWEIAIFSGVSLELLLSFLVYNARASKIAAAFAIAITVYAVVQTAAGQTFALLTHTVTAGISTETTTADFTMEECKRNMTRLSSEADTINAQLRSLQSAEARSQYAVTIANATRRLEAISAERARNMDTLLKMSSSTVNTVRSGEERKSIYNFYSSMPSWSGSDWLKFAFHFLFSVFVAIMAPIGIITWGQKAEHGVTFTRQQVEMFVNTAWYKIKNNTGVQILSEIQYNDLLQRRGHPVEAGVYFSLVNQCVNFGFVNTSGVALEKDHAKVIKKLSGERTPIWKRLKFSHRADSETSSTPSL